MSTAMLAGHRVTHARAQIPAFGVWWADVGIDEPVELSGPVELTIADLSLSGTVMSGGPTQGRSNFRIAGGKGAWGKEIPSRHYATDNGVKISTVVQDAADAAGESLDASTLPSTRMGPAFARVVGPASLVLQQLLSEAWYVGEDGVTRAGRRPVVELDDPGAMLGPVDRAAGIVTVAAESIARILPGVRVGGLDAVDVMHEVSAEGGLRSYVWGRGISDTSRHVKALRRIFEQLDPLRKYRGIYEYRVVSQAGQRLDLQPLRVSTGMPDLRSVPIRPGVHAVEVDVTVGSLVLVGFVDSHPSRPVVLGFDGAAEDLPSTLSEGGRVVRYGDTIEVPVSGVPTPITLTRGIVPPPTATLSRVKA